MLGTTPLIVFLALGAVVNLLLVLCLAHTWKHWRQVKFYIVMLAVGNVVELVFTEGVMLGWTVSGSWLGSEASCKFLMLMTLLGPSLVAMSLAALSLHVLLTAITGCQGDRLRHALVMGLFGVLSLLVPLVQPALYTLMAIPNPVSGLEGNQCVMSRAFMHDDDDDFYTYYAVGVTTALFFFPAAVSLCCQAAAGTALCLHSQGNRKGDASASDVVISGLVGIVFLLCSLPQHLMFLFRMVDPSILSDLDAKTANGIIYFRHCMGILIAVVVVVFAYVHAFRTRGRESSKPPSGERQKLVN